MGDAQTSLAVTTPRLALAVRGSCDGGTTELPFKSEGREEKMSELP